MSGTEQTDRIIRFGVFELDTVEGELRRSGRLVALPAQPMRVLQLLVSRAGALVTRDELQREIWGDQTHVDFDAGLSTCINQIRSALGDRAQSPRFIETVPRRGYRFIAPLVEVQEEIGLTLPAAPRMQWSTLAPTTTLFAVVVLGLFMSRYAMRPAPIPIAVMAVDVDQRLQPLASAFETALTGTLASALGSRGRLAGPLLVRELREKPLPEMTEAGITYAVLVMMHSLGGPVLLHVKVVDSSGYVKWVSDRSIGVDELQSRQLDIATEVSKQLALALIPS